MLPLDSARGEGWRRLADRPPLATLDVNRALVHPQRELAKPGRARGRSSAPATIDERVARRRSPCLAECPVDGCLRGCTVCMPLLTSRQLHVCDDYFNFWRRHVEKEQTRALCSGDQIMMAYHNNGHEMIRVKVVSPPPRAP